MSRRYKRQTLLATLDVDIYRKEALITAKELSYDNTIISSLKNAKTINELTRIMVTARKN